MKLIKRALVGLVLVTLPIWFLPATLYALLYWIATGQDGQVKLYQLFDSLLAWPNR